MFGTGQDAATVSEFLGALDTELALIDDREALRPLLAELTPRDRTILALRFFRHLTQTQIADQVGLSQMHVSRVLTKTLSFLQQRMNNSD
jgi:RNA polymerase sigma-B factor